MSKNIIQLIIQKVQKYSNWNIPVEGKISGIFCGFIDNHSFELLGEDGNYYAVSTLKLTNEDFSELESEKTNITIEYIIEDEGSQLTLLKIIEKNQRVKYKKYILKFYKY